MSNQSILKVRASLHWLGFKSSLPSEVSNKRDLNIYVREQGFPEIDIIDYYGTYSGFRSWLLSLHGPEFLYDLNTVVITDAVYKASAIKGDKVNFADILFDSNTLQILPKNVIPSDVLRSLQFQKKGDYQLFPLNAYNHYYKEVLATYDRVTFFDQFNTFKYILNKDLRKELEDCVYRFYIGVDSLEVFRDSFRTVEAQLKPAQLDKYQTVKDFVFSERTEVLKVLINESDQEKLKAALNKYSLDYFDVNYLKAYLRDYGKTKEEKGKKKARVQELKFEDTNISEEEIYTSPMYQDEIHND